MIQLLNRIEVEGFMRSLKEDIIAKSSDEEEEE